MMEGLAFLPVPDLTIGIHLLRTLCPDDQPEAAELLDYFDSTYISGHDAYLFPGKYYRRQHRIWVFVSFVQKIAI
jgi:hypothetical protein